jgi:mannose PTS system EIIA component
MSLGRSLSLRRSRSVLRTTWSSAGVVILTDMFGGTPSNLAISVMDGGRIEVICGVNLPMLIKLATMRESADLDHAVVEARDAGRKYITIASKVLAGK